jgi:hypothetical protein
MPRILVPNLRACRILCIASCFHCHILLMLCILVWNCVLPSYFLLLLFRKSFVGIYEDDKNSTSASCFYVLVNSNLSMRTCLLLSYMLEVDFIFFVKACFVAYFSNKKKGRCSTKVFFFSFVLLFKYFMCF